MKIYLAGPHDHSGFRTAARIAVRLAAPPSRRPLVELIDPMRRDFRGREYGNEAEIVQGDLADIVASDVILADWTKPSVGTAMESWFAFSIGRPICGFVGDARVSPWHTYVAESVQTEFFAAIEAALDRPALKQKGRK